MTISIKAQRANAPKFMAVDGSTHFEVDRVVLGAGQSGTPAATNTLDFRIPAGAQVFDLAFQLDDCDTGTTVVFGVGFRPVNPGSTLARNDTYFAAAGQTTGQGGGRLTCAFKPIQFEEDVFIHLLVGAAPTGISGNPEVVAIAGYNCRGAR